MKFTADDIAGLLTTRHSKDIFILECKNGPSWGNGLCRLDAWAMKRSWAHQLSIGYEIKVSRGDFLKDDKWHSYLNYCNEFYFVCPANLIDVSELPSGIGLLWVSKTGNMLYVKKKAHRRDVEIPEEFYRYILMCRTKIVPSTLRYYVDSDSKTKYWKQWLSEKSEKLDIGHISSKKLRELVDKRIFDVESKNETLIKEISYLKDIQEFCKSIGFPYSGWNGSGFRTKEKIEEIKTGIPKDFINQLDNTRELLAKIKDLFNA